MSQPKARVWDIDMMVDQEQGALVGEFRAEARAEFEQLENLLYRLGGAVVIAARRVPDPSTGRFFTIGYTLEWQSFVPGGTQPAPQPAQEPVPDPVAELEPEPELVADAAS